MAAARQTSSCCCSLDCSAYLRMQTQCGTPAARLIAGGYVVVLPEQDKTRPCYHVRWNPDPARELKNSQYPLTKKRPLVVAFVYSVGAPGRLLAGFARRPRCARDRRRCAVTSFGALRAPRRTPDPLVRRAFRLKMTL